MLERMLVVGLGSIGQRHVRIARMMLPHARLAVLRHRPCDHREHAAVEECFHDIESALAFRPAVAVVASPATHHLATATRLAEAGVHLLVEKPLAERAEGVGRLLDASRTHGTTLMIGYNLRFLPSLRAFRDAIQGGTLGRLYSVRVEIGQYLPSWRPDTDYRTSVSARRALGGGVLLELSHELDYLRWIFGEADWVSATLGRVGTLEIDVEDSAHLVLELRSEAGPRVQATVSMDFLRHDTTRTCTVIGERGTLRWNAIAGTVELFAAGADSWKLLSSTRTMRDDTYIAEWREFLSAIAKGRPPLVSGEDGLAVLRIIDAARRSAELRAAVPLATDHGGGGQ